MAENPTEVVSTTMIGFDDFLKESEIAIDLLTVRMKRRGIEMTELEVWQYLCWCHANVGDILAQLGNGAAAPTVSAVRQSVGETCGQHFIQKRTGVLAPPVGPRFDSPFELESKRRIPDTGIVTQADGSLKFDGYL